ncbi:helix-turn-helix transcriptional regulator [Paenibacillus eucommiae]|uniref:DNA-binding transcriptional regulator YafY n=1 Tax=Paenibacillus eucommiae TaxID=1355755 RepID=A0ABS4IXM4_9BACL|nr:YafY family protein [Paenibacillus eucommiae]MBP1992312.1 putative DNA-binding transcriptional regulator YafY [Paenibacillus eucommiae]
MAKSDQMLSILWLLRSRERMTAEELAEALEISIRTVYRYIDSLCASGVPVVSEPGYGGGYSLPKNFHKAPLFFDSTELKAMVHAAQFAEKAGYPFVQALEKALTKMRQHMNGRQIDDLNRHVGGIEVLSYLEHNAAESILQTLEHAAADCLTLSISYLKWKGQAPEKRQLNPYGLVHRNHKWYLLAYCLVRQDIRVFRVDRIMEAVASDTNFEKPLDFSVREYFEELMMPKGIEPGEQIVDMKIRGELQALDQLCDHWVLRDYLIARDGEMAHFQLDYSGMMAFMPQTLLFYGKRLDVVEPEELKHKLIETALDLAKHYTNIPDHN